MCLLNMNVVMTASNTLFWNVFQVYNTLLFIILHQSCHQSLSAFVFDSNHPIRIPFKGFDLAVNLTHHVTVRLKSL